MQGLDQQWPAWTNPAVRLYHGTSKIAADSIMSEVTLTEARANTDFGRGFYTTTRQESAEDFAVKRFRRKDPVVISLEVDRSALGELGAIAFVRGTLDAIDFWSFVHHCRYGGVQNHYDVAYGPVAKTWDGPRQSSLYEGYDQIAFLSARALRLLNNPALTIKVIL